MAPGFGPCALYRLAYLTCLLILGSEYIIIPTLQVRKLGDREVKQLAQGHTGHLLEKVKEHGLNGRFGGQHRLTGGPM